MKRTIALRSGALALVLAACSPARLPAGDADTRAVPLTMTEATAFEPTRVEVSLGETVEFAIRNASGDPHEAYVGTADEQAMHERDHSALSVDEQGSATHMGYGVHIAPFGTGQLAYTFDRAGEREIGCHYPGHYEAGMRVVVEVSGS